MISFRQLYISIIPGLILTILIIISFPSCKKENTKIMDVRNDSIKEILYTSAKAFATIIDIGSGIDQHGHCWSTSADFDVDINDGKSEHGSSDKAGSYTSVLNGLSPDTKYYVKAYVKKSSTVVYSDNILSFHTLLISLPVVATGTVKNITTNGATLTGNLNSFGSGVSSVSQHGHCWSDKKTTPTIDDDKTSLGSKEETGSFESDIIDLSPDKLYYVRAYATNDAGTAYGDAVSFNTLAIETVPQVTTGIIYDITQTNASASGNLDDFGSGFTSVSQYGHCWSNTTVMPTISDTKSSLGTRSTTGSFESDLTDLAPDVQYFVRAYATNGAGTGYGDPVSFSTAAAGGNVPEVKTASVGPITGTTATSGGSITSDGGSSITAKGICWSTNRFPTTSDYSTNEGSGTGSFVSVMTGLQQKTLYYVRAYATNASGTGYGDEIAFVTDFDCGTRLTDPRDMKTYLTVQIGSQCWMAENLNVGQRIDGVQNSQDNSVIEKYCYEDNESNCNLYGGIYQWDEMMQYTTIEMTQGVCPKGWHIPSDYEWKTLEKELGMSQAEADASGWRGSDEGGQLKAAGTAYWESPNEGATNSSLFTALPAGGRDNAGNFGGLGYFTDYWTSTLIIDTQSWYRLLSSDESRIQRIDGNRDYGTSVRCVED